MIRAPLEDDNQSSWVWRKTTNPAAFEGTRRSAQLSFEEQDDQHRCKWSSNGNGNRGARAEVFGALPMQWPSYLSGLWFVVAIAFL